jgi:hypothetical protein
MQVFTVRIAFVLGVAGAVIGQRQQLIAGNGNTA